MARSCEKAKIQWGQYVNGDDTFPSENTNEVSSLLLKFTPVEQDKFPMSAVQER